MGSCPVCLKSLMEEYAEPGKNNYTKDQRKRQAQLGNNFKGIRGTLATNKTIYLLPEAEIVVSTKCGHLFHKLCLRDYIVTFRQITRQNFVECPICQERIILSSTLVVDLRANDGCTEKTDKELKHAEIMNRELRSQIEDAQNKIAVVNKDIQEKFNTFQLLQIQQSKNYEEWNSKQTVLQQINGVKDAIGKNKEDSDILKRENIELASIYLCMLSRDTNSKFPEEIPKKLQPYLQIIHDNRDLLKAFIKVIAPLRTSTDKFQCYGHASWQENLIEAMIERIRIINPSPEPEPEFDTEPEMDFEKPETDFEKHETESEYELENEPKTKNDLNNYFDTNKKSIIALEKTNQPCTSEPSDLSVKVMEKVIPDSTIPKRVGKAPNNFVHGVQTVLTVMVDENKKTSTEESSEIEEVKHLPDLTKQRKFRSKITDQRDVYCARDKIYAKQGIAKPPRNKRHKKKYSATTILTSPHTDYSNLVKVKKSIISNEDLRELYRRQNFITTESFLEVNKVPCKDLEDQKRQVSLQELKCQFDNISGTTIEPKVRKGFISLTDASPILLEKKQMVSTGSQMSDHDLLLLQSSQNSPIPTILTQPPISSEDFGFVSDGVSLVESKYSTFRFSSEKSLNSGMIKVPTFNAKARKTDGYTSSKSLDDENKTRYGSCPSSASLTRSRTRLRHYTPKKTLSSGFEVNHLAIVDYFGCTKHQTSLESFSSLNQLDNCTGKPSERRNNNSKHQNSDDNNTQNFSVNRQESTYFIPSFENETDWEEDGFKPNPYLLDLTNLPSVDESIKNFKVPEFTIPPPLDLSSTEEIDSQILPCLSQLTLESKLISIIIPNDQCSKIPTRIPAVTPISNRHILNQISSTNSEYTELQVSVNKKSSPVDLDLKLQTIPSSPNCSNDEPMEFDLHSTFSEQLVALMVPPPPPYDCLNAQGDKSTFQMITSNQIRGFREPELINTMPSKTLSIFEWLPEPPENRDGAFYSHAEIEPEVALIIQSRQAYQLRKQSQAQRTILKVRRKIV